MIENINWKLIAKLPADGLVYNGGVEYGAFRVRHLPATRTRVAQLLAETGRGLFRRRFVSKPGAPSKLAATEQISGSIIEG